RPPILDSLSGIELGMFHSEGRLTLRVIADGYADPGAIDKLDAPVAPLVRGRSRSRTLNFYAVELPAVTAFIKQRLQGSVFVACDSFRYRELELAIAGLTVLPQPSLLLEGHRNSLRPPFFVIRGIRHEFQCLLRNLGMVHCSCTGVF